MSPVSHARALVDHWFRALDQRPVRIGLHDFVLHITGICVENGEVWIQLADGSGDGGSILLHVDSSASIDQAVRALSARIRGDGARPLIVSLTSAADRLERAAGQPHEAVPQVAITN